MLDIRTSLVVSLLAFTGALLGSTLGVNDTDAITCHSHVANTVWEKTIPGKVYDMEIQSNSKILHNEESTLGHPCAKHWSMIYEAKPRSRRQLEYSDDEGVYKVLGQGQLMAGRS